ncbi:polysaccharide biosynthesis protein [Nitrincola schmidtii]|uniref:polysaccharide biosynthesis protein n=1 Tax=Nitrincola schmidtii TaxID=1730894 RepID=UPI001F10E174|nr:nucleoside-diphosphate sugar epimerase/dehydratase [Nitrincola schmidtii]
MRKAETPDSLKQPIHLRLLSMERGKKRWIMVLADLIVLPFALYTAYVLRFHDFWPVRFLEPAIWLFLWVPVFGIAVFIKLGLYRAVVRYMGSQAIWTVVAGVSILSLSLWAAAFVFRIQPFPRSIPINFALLAFVYVGGTRLLMRSYYHWLMNRFLEKESVLIYGAGSSGVQLAKALSGTHELCCIGFIDDDPSLWGSSVAGLKVFKPGQVQSLIQGRKIDSVLLAMPSATPKQRKRILNRLSNFPVHVRTVPPMHEIVSGESVVNLRDVAIEDLLGRDPVPPIKPLIDASVRNKVVMVTGAGGSIGSELCRQILKYEPKCLVLYELSEYALYSLEQEVSSLLSKKSYDVPYISMLGSVCDVPRIEDTIQRFQVQTIYHAAAYKHVPLVEHNVLEGIRNNTLGTLVLAKSAQKLGVERFVLVSTDKAVRPTNVMGATKRLAELILQDLATQSSNTIFSMVRFGNVLGSSGSVVPLFRKQIEEGGPVTVTHPDITRYFMTIPEAASLVIQAGSMAKGGDVFVLDMGESVPIVDLARRMIRLMGYEVCDDKHPDGDIEIIFTGLRPGEKLYEELLIGDDVIGTDHPKIMRALEEKLSSDDLQRVLSGIQYALDQHDSTEARFQLEKAVAGFKPSTAMVDWLAIDLVKQSEMR